MPIWDVASSVGVAVAYLVGLAALGVSLPVVLKLVIAEVEKVKVFKPLSKNLASTMEKLVPLFKEINLMQEEIDPGKKDELKVLFKMMQKAEEMIQKCARLEWYHIVQKVLYTREIKEINQELLSFCEFELQLIIHSNLLQTRRLMTSVTRTLVLRTAKFEQQVNELPPKEFRLMMNLSCRRCNLCKSVIEDERPMVVFGVLWHPECFCCDACHKPIAIHEAKNHISNSRGKYHKSCYRKYRRPICYVCKEKIPSTAEGIRYNEHLYWKKKYCPFHESDGTPMCFSCERLEPKGTKYGMLGDGRRQCLECRESAVMDTYQCQPLHIEIREFFKGLKLKVEKDFPLLLVEKQTLNKADKLEQDHYNEVVTRGICLSKEIIISSVRPSLGPNNLLIDMATESRELVRRCDVTAILIIYGLPWFLTGYLLAHEMMHAYLRLNGYRNLDQVLEEGICQVLGRMWLESQTRKKTKCSAFEKKLVEFCKHQIETDDSPIYGLGFKKVKKMVLKNWCRLHDTLKEIADASKILPDSKFSKGSCIH